MMTALSLPPTATAPQQAVNWNSQPAAEIPPDIQKIADNLTVMRLLDKNARLQQDNDSLVEYLLALEQEPQP